MAGNVLTTGRDRVFTRTPGASVIAATDTLSDGDVIVAAPGSHTVLVLEHGNRFDLSAPRVLSGIHTVLDRSVGDSVITMRAGLDVVLHLGRDNATVHGAADASVIIGGVAGGYATVFLGSARESVIAGSSGATVMMDAADAGARIAGRGVTTVQLTGRYGDAVRLGTEVHDVAELDVNSAGLRVDARAAQIAAVALSASQINIALGPATTLVTDYVGGNLLAFCVAGQILRLPMASMPQPADHVSGFVAGDAIGIDLPYGTTEHLSYIATTGQLTLEDTSSGASARVFLSPGGPARFQLSPDHAMPSGDTGTLITMMGAPAQAPCYAAGTRLLAPAGLVAVEHLAIGDTLITQAGTARPIRWIGQRRVECGAHPTPDLVLPIRILAGAFGEGVPHTDLRLSPDHAVFVEGALIPVKYLVNGATIRRESVRQVRYFHIELDSHDVVLAEGLPVETYLDTGNRHQFAGQSVCVSLHPNFAPMEWPAHALAPLLTAGPALRAVRAALLARAEALGWRTTQDPDLHLCADGQRIWGREAGGMWSGWVPPRPRALTVCSRAAAPADCEAGSDDLRLLGVALRRIVVRSAKERRVLSAQALGWGAGFHPAEQDDWARWRWTDGRGVLLPALWQGLTGPLQVELHLFRSLGYRLEETGAPLQTMRAAGGLSRGLG